MTIWTSWKHHLCAMLLLGAMSLQGAGAAPVLSLGAANPATLGGTVKVDVSVDAAADLYGYQFSLLFDPALFRATAATEGGFLAGGGATYFDAGSIDNTLGSISFVFASLLGDVPGVSGSGLLASFGFDVIGSGTGSFALADLLVLDANVDDVGAQGGTLSVAVPEPSVYGLLAIGLMGCALARRRRG